MSDADHPSVDELLAAAYALDGPEANRVLYRRWAATYDTGFIVDSGYRYHEHVAAVFAARCLGHLRPGDVVADIGCGTGLGGQALRRHGDATDIVIDIAVDGIDISPDMLGQAATKVHGDGPVYRRLIEADLTAVLPIADDTYGGAVSIGTFTHGHVGPGALQELIRIIRPGGRAAIGVNAAHFGTEGFGATFDELVRLGRVGDLHVTDAPIYDGADMSDPDQVAHIVTFVVI